MYIILLSSLLFFFFLKANLIIPVFEKGPKTNYEMLGTGWPIYAYKYCYAIRISQNLEFKKFKILI